MCDFFFFNFFKFLNHGIFFFFKKINFFILTELHTKFRDIFLKFIFKSRQINTKKPKKIVVLILGDVVN